MALVGGGGGGGSVGVGVGAGADYGRRLVRVRDEVGAANGAGRVGREPGVDAVGVEDVVALGEQAKHIAPIELGEADGALQSPLADLVVFDVGIHQHGERLDHRRIEPPQRPRPVGTSAGGVPVDREVAPLGALPDVDGEEAHHEEHADEHDDDDGHGGVEPGAVHAVARRIGAWLRLGSAADESEE